MKILLSGASGLIGSHLMPVLQSKGHDVHRLVRRATAGPGEVPWEPGIPPQLNGFDAVIHLAGETIMGRWTTHKKACILESRATGTCNLAAALACAAVRPKAFLVASAVGYYGPRGDEIITEQAAPGHDFLSRVSEAWEAGADPARRAGIRVVNLRIGMVLAPQGGALKQMLLPFRLGLGGRIGSGKQWVSWIALEDVIGIILFALENESLAEAINVVAPNPVSNAEFTSALGEALHRPTLFPLPAAVVKLVFGEMGETLLLAGQRVIPAKLQANGYRFKYAEIREALCSMLR